MFLLAALGLTDVADLDPSRPLQVGDYQLSTEAAVEAVRILNGGEFDARISIAERTIEGHIYWSVVHKFEGQGEIFAFSGWEDPLPTAIEIAIVRALAALPPNEHARVLRGNHEIAIGSPAAVADFQKVVSLTKTPLVGASILSEAGLQVFVSEQCGKLFTETARKCLENAFSTAPLKFRFLEIYRVMEARFISNIKDKMLREFDAEPASSLEEALESLKSEMTQIVSLAETQQVIFEQCWTALDAIKVDNRLAAALFRKIRNRHAALAGVRWKVGAALIYMLRCAIVHAGQKDLIFENFPDGDDALNAVMPFAEKAALALIGFELSEA